MSNVNYSNGKFFLTESGQQPQLLLDVRTPFVNRSRINSHQFAQEEKNRVIFPLEQIVNNAAKKIFQRTLPSLAEVVTYMRIVARLLRKPQIHTVLRLGQSSPFDAALTETLQKFNPANKIFHPEKVEAYLLPENRFDTVIFFAQNTPPIELLLAVKDFGSIYLIAPSATSDGLLRTYAKIFPLTEQAALFELTVSPQVRQEIRRRTPQGQFDEKFSAINQVVAKLPDVLKKFDALSRKKKNSHLDEYITEVIRAEKILSEIFPMLASDTIKFNFNLLKEFLIDLRLGNGAIARVRRQHEILLHELSST